jgi:hypothetical protein
MPWKWSVTRKITILLEVLVYYVVGFESVFQVFSFSLALNRLKLLKNAWFVLISYIAWLVSHTEKKIKLTKYPIPLKPETNSNYSANSKLK